MTDAEVIGGIPPRDGYTKTLRQLRADYAAQQPLIDAIRPSPSERGAAAVKALPSEIKVGAYTYKIVVMGSQESAAKGRYGECASVELRIGIQEWFASPAKAVDTFLHECLHAIFYERGIEGEDKEERTVGLLSTGLTALFLDNPWLPGWISENLK
jgi:hypothetical protein